MVRCSGVSKLRMSANAGTAALSRTKRDDTLPHYGVIHRQTSSLNNSPEVCERQQGQRPTKTTGLVGNEPLLSQPWSVNDGLAIRLQCRMRHPRVEQRLHWWHLCRWTVRPSLASTVGWALARLSIPVGLAFLEGFHAVEPWEMSPVDSPASCHLFRDAIHYLPAREGWLCRSPVSSILLSYRVAPHVGKGTSMIGPCT